MAHWMRKGMTVNKFSYFIGFVFLAFVPNHYVMAGGMASTVPQEIEAYARAHDCEIENVEDPQDTGARYIYGVLPGYKSGYKKKQDNAAVVCIGTKYYEHPVLGRSFYDRATLLLIGVNNKFTCQDWLALPSNGTAAISVKDGTWNLSEFKILDDDGEPGSWGPTITVATRMIILDWYGGSQIGVLCHSGKWYGQMLWSD